ncbi:MAG: hypothetical protein JWQ04_2902 [Pedosphaera sp.]|nr:hypothetical protein [Pedosphaera sp.]
MAVALGTFAAHGCSRSYLSIGMKKGTANLGRAFAFAEPSTESN